MVLSQQWWGDEFDEYYNGVRRYYKDLVREWSWVNSKECDEVAAEKWELEADLGNVVCVHWQRLWEELDCNEDNFKL